MNTASDRLCRQIMGASLASTWGTKSAPGSARYLALEEIVKAGAALAGRRRRGRSGARKPVASRGATPTAVMTARAMSFMHEVTLQEVQRIHRAEDA
jgi:hypothetical protein